MEKFATGRPHTVLLVDDDHDARTALREVLADEGFKVVEAPNGRVAVDYLLAAEVLPGLILLDLNMPLMSGWEVVRILSGNARLAKIPIALVTSDPASGFPSETLVGRLMKPYELDDLLALVKRHVQPEPSDPADVAA